MSNKDRITIFPSRANNVLIKNRLVSANKGLSMLKKKRDALELKLRDLIAQRQANVVNCNELFREALFSIAKANFLETDLKPTPIIGSDRADAFMRMTFVKTIGLSLPTFEPVIRKSESLPLTGLSRGGMQVDVIREKFQELLRVLIMVASHDYSIKILKEAIRTTNTRLNGLEYVIIPRLVNTCAYIINELDELEREEFYRLKRSQQKQRKLKENKKKGEMKTETEEEEEEEEEEKEEEKGEEQKEEKPKKDYIDAATSIDFLSSIVSIYRKRKMANTAQTLITGHYPSSNEVISPTESLISGTTPLVTKRTSFVVSKLATKSNIIQMPEKDNNEASTSTAAVDDSVKDSVDVPVKEEVSDPVKPESVEDGENGPEA